MTTSHHHGPVRTDIWFKTQVQLGGGLLFGALLPFIVFLWAESRAGDMDVFRVSLVASLVAVASGYYFFRSLIAFPGIRASYYVVPAFSSTFAVVFTAILLLRLEYSRPVLLVGYVLCVAWYYLVYFMIQRQPNLTIGVVPFGEIDTLRSIERVNWVTLDAPALQPRQRHAIVADFRADMPDEWERFLADAALAGRTVFHVKQLRESLTGRVEIAHLSENAYGSLVPDAAYRNGKVLFDVVMAVLALVVLLPVVAVVALLIKLDSPGPIFFRQTRVGYRGVPFKVWKFRTMSHAAPVDADADDRSHAITRDNDVRITRLGRVMRRTRVDELPQVFNVLVGQMSMIGPRPEAAVLSRWYEQEIPFYRYRHIVRPGITGWAQVNQGHVADVADVLEKLHYDFYYISNYSLWLDLLIVFRTIRTVVTGFGSK